jgi:hypothetical protein
VPTGGDGDQVVIPRVGTTDREECAGLRLGDLDQGEGINLGSLCGGTGGGKPVGERSIDEDVEGRADFSGISVKDDFLLGDHDFFEAGLFDQVGYLVPHSPGWGIGFEGIGEHPESVETEVADKREQFLMLGVGFAGKTGDEGRANGYAGDSGANSFQQSFRLSSGNATVHGSQNAIVDVLEGDIDVLDHLLGFSNGVDHVVGEDRGVSVHQADPDQAIEGIKFAEQPGEAKAVVQIGSVASGILTDEDEFDRAVGDQFAGFSQNTREGLGMHSAADGGDRAEGAFLVATFADAEVGIVRWSQSEASGVDQSVGMIVAEVQIRGFSLLSGRSGRFEDSTGEVAAVVDTDKGVDARNVLEQTGPITLDQTAGYDNPSAPSGPLGIDRLDDGLVGFVAGGLKETTRVDHDDVGIGRVIGDGAAGLGKLPEHFLRIHQVLGATQRDEGDSRNSFLCRHLRQPIAGTNSGLVPL